MDESLKYIDMCRKATEIQEAWQPDDWDYCLCEANPDYAEEQEQVKEVVVLSGYETDGGFYGHDTTIKILSNPPLVYENNIRCTSKHIWLPKQDQLQEIIFSEANRDWSSHLKLLNAIMSFAKFVHCRCHGKSCPGYIESEIIKQGFKFPSFDTMEQLWLGLVMLEGYNKVWTGKDWISL